MAENSKLKILNIMNGAEFGGAELFFERLLYHWKKEQVLVKKF